MSDLYTDGNGAAGLLAEILAGDATSIRRRCASCGDEDVLAAHRCYTSAGVVLRCPACEDVAVQIGISSDSLVVEWHGTFRIPRPEALTDVPGR